MTVTQNILNNWVKGDDPEMVQIAKEEEENVYKMFRECVEEENLGRVFVQGWIYHWFE